MSRSKFQERNANFLFNDEQIATMLGIEIVNGLNFCFLKKSGEKFFCKQVDLNYLIEGEDIETGRFHNIQKGTYKNETVAIKYINLTKVAAEAKNTMIVNFNLEMEMQV